MTAPHRSNTTPVLSARGLSKSYGAVVALDDVDIDLYRGEVLAVIGDNGAGKSTLIKCLTGAETADNGVVRVDEHVIRLRGPQDSQSAGIEAVYQTLSIAPALDIASNLFLGRERRRDNLLGSVFRLLNHGQMRRDAARMVRELGIETIQDISQPVETLSGGQRQAVAVARAAAFGSKVVILDEPTAALGVRESSHVLEMIRGLRDRGLAVLLISHDMPQVFDVADRIHIQRLGRCAGVTTPNRHSMEEGVAIMTGAATLPRDEWVTHATTADPEQGT